MSKLSKEKLGEFYLRRIRPGLAKHGRGRPPWRQPTVLFIAGQPGAGKTTMQAAAIDRLGMKKAYVVDHDELLEKHPNYASGALEDDYSASGVYGEDASAWRGWALQDVQSRRMDVVVPFPISGQYDLDLMKSFQDKGYRVEVAFAAVHESQSQLGIMERFNDGRQEAGYGRWIGAQQHDQIYRDMLGTADAIEARGLADAVHVYRRGEAEPVFTNERTNGVWRHQIGSSRWAIENERNRPWTDREVNHFVRGYNKLADLARRPLKDHFKAMPLMATREGHRLLAKLQQTAAPKLAEHQRLTALRTQAQAQPAQQPGQQPAQQPGQRSAQQPHQPQPGPPRPQQPPWAQQPRQQPVQPQQVPLRPEHAPHQQHVAQPWQEQATRQMPQHQQPLHSGQQGARPQQPQQPVAGAQDPRWAAGMQGGARAVGGQQQPRQVPPPQQVPPRPEDAPHQQHVAQSWQEQTTQQPQSQQPQSQQGQGYDWQQFAVRLQVEQSPASGISVPVAEGQSQPAGDQRPQRGQSAARDDRGGGDNGRLAR